MAGGGGTLIDFIQPSIHPSVVALVPAVTLTRHSPPPSSFNPCPSLSLSPVLLPAPCSCIEASKEQRVLCAQQLSLLYGRRRAP